jgi:hypothetical protein
MLAGTPDAVVKTLVRAAGATLITSAAVKYTLKVGQAAVRKFTVALEYRARA